MGKGLLFIVAATILGAGVYGNSGRLGQLATTERKAFHDAEILARNAALSGYALAKQRMANSFTPTSLSGSTGEASYTATVWVDGESARIRSTGTYGAAFGPATEVTVVAEFQRELVDVFDVVPPFMQYALLSDGALSLRGDILGEIYVQGIDDSRLNANMHTNDALSVDGNSVRVQGFGTFVSSASFSSPKAAENSFVPNYNSSASAAVARTPVVTIPTYNADAYLSRRAANATTVGDLSLSGAYDLGGTRNNPYLWHVTGNLTISSATTFSGYVLFLVDQHVNAYGNVTAGTSGYAGADESSVAIYAGGSIELGGSTTVYAQIYAGGDVVFLNGTPTVYGSVTTKGAAELRGTPNIYYRKASPALTYMWQEPRTAVRLTSYVEDVDGRST